jgi:large subunit ribosomal protein L1
MAVASKRYRKAAEKFDRAKVYSVRDGVAVLKALPPAKFDETVDVAIHLGIDPKKSDQLVRGAVPLPKGLGRTVKVVVFARAPRRRRPPAPTRSDPRISRSGSPTAGPTSTSSSQLPT